MCPSWISTTADIYSHLNYSSKLNVANTLTNAFGEEMIDADEQDSYETKALLSNIFRGAEHEQAKAVSEPVKAIENDFVAEDEEELEEQDDLSYNKDLEEVDESIVEFRKVKEKMARLGFTDYDEYLDYLEYMERRAARKKDMEM